MRLFGYLITTAMVTMAVPVLAGDLDVVSAWYHALKAVDRERIADLLTDDATIQLDDFGIEQSKAEFITALDEWEAAAKGADIRYRIEGVRTGKVIVEACYQFPHNEVLMREQFRIDADKIRESIQANISHDCGEL